MPFLSVFAIAKDLLTKFLALPPRTQVTLSWGVLILSIFCISGLWKLKFIFTMFLLLFKPVVSNLAPSEANSNNKSKSKKQRDASGAHFSDDPLIAALQVSQAPLSRLACVWVCDCKGRDI